MGLPLPSPRDTLGPQAVRITTNTGGTNIQLYQYGLQLEPNTDYQLAFAAYSSTGHDFRVSLCKHVSPYTNYGSNKVRADLTAGWKTFTINFRTTNFSAPVNDGRLYFWFADDAQAGDQFFIDEVVLTKNREACVSSRGLPGFLARLAPDAPPHETWEL